MLGQLGDHPNIATILDRWDENGTAAMVTRFLPGGSLLELIAHSNDAGEGLPADDILKYSEALAQALTHIHGRGILYRDLQPRNVRFDAWGAVRLVDFDTAVTVGDNATAELPHGAKTGYVAPELVDSGRGDDHSDLYSLGVTIYEMCEGQPPFSGTRDEIQAARGAGPPPAPSRQDIPDDLRELITSLTASAPEQRPRSAAEVAARLAGLRAYRAGIERYLADDESMTLEFKSSLRAAFGPPATGDNKRPRELARASGGAILKTIAAFQNTDGGTLIIGVTDNRQIIGIEADYPSTGGSRDGWRLAFDDLVSRHLGADAMSAIDLRLEPWRGRTIAVIRCRPRKEPTWMDDDLFVRRTASTEKLPTRRAMTWIREKWGQTSNQDPHS